jgi:hypothetical protein
MRFDLSQLSVADTLTCSVHLRKAIDGEATVEATARRACAFFHESFVDARRQRSLALARLYVTHPHAQLPADDQRFARKLLTGPAAQWPNLKCLTLLATRGDQEEWNDRTRSRGHRAIPLPTTAIVQKAPMIAQLFTQMGVELSTVLKAEPSLFPDLTKRTYNVFHVTRALGSPYIPAQEDFVRRHGIESVVGFGGALPWGEHFAVVLFSRTPISPTVASRFKSFALDLKARLIKFTGNDIFEADDRPKTDPEAPPARAPLSRAQASSLANVEARVTGAPRSVDGFRQFRDSGGVDWNVWAVVPAMAVTLRLRGDQWKSGWLLFECDSGSRRLSPIPDNWLSSDDARLERFCQSAKPTRK